MSRFGRCLIALLLLAACTPRHNVQKEAEDFLARYNRQYQRLYYQASLAEWASNTHIVEGDETNAKRTRQAEEALAAFTGSVENIAECRRLLQSREELEPLTVRQLETALYQAANNPATVPELVKARIAAETDQVEKLFGFGYTLGGRPVTTNQIDDILKREKNPKRRLAAWIASKEVGRNLRSGLGKLQRLRNQTVQALGYADFFAYQVSDYGMTTREMMELMERINRELRPLYRELHTWARYTLARRYRKPVPELIPAHWLPNRWGQDWQGLVKVRGLDLDRALGRKKPSWVIQQAERFYVSLGFDPLPPAFYQRSSLYPVAADAPYRKNNHASAWHLDLDQDFRCLMSLESNMEWYETAHHELGHIYYYRAYSRPEVPLLLRRGANRAFHEGLGSLLGLAALQPRFAAAAGLVSPGARLDLTQTLLREALNYVVFIPFSAGVMTEFERELYSEELPAQEWNRRWWELKARYQGIAAPGPRGGDLCDPATKTHINDDPAQYYDYALSNLILFQLHQYIARQILHQDPHDTNYFGHPEVGDFLRRIMSPGGTVDWRQLLKETTGEELSARPMLDYFAPLMAWLKKENRGRRYTLPEL